MTDSNTIQKKIKKCISRGVKYLREYRLKMIEEQKKQGIKYDGGVTILLSYLEGKYGIELGFKKKCNNLVKCGQEYSIVAPKSVFIYGEQENDLFETNFLRDIFLQKSNQYTLNNYINKMEKYLQGGDGLISQLIPILDIFSQRHVRYLNVGLGLFGLMEKRRDKTIADKSFLHLKKRVSTELVNIFINKSNYDDLYLDTTKAYSLFLLHLLEEDSRIEETDHEKFINCMLKNQSSLGNWIHTDTFDKTNEVNNMILTIFCVINLLHYYTKVKSNKEVEKEKQQTEMIQSQSHHIEGFVSGLGGGGMFKQETLDSIFSQKGCMGSVIEVMLLILALLISGYIMFRIYKYQNI
jgi:hypothetical protein